MVESLVFLVSAVCITFQFYMYTVQLLFTLDTTPLSSSIVPSVVSASSNGYDTVPKMCVCVHVHAWMYACVYIHFLSLSSVSLLLELMIFDFGVELSSIL